MVVTINLIGMNSTISRQFLKNIQVSKTVLHIHTAHFWEMVPFLFFFFFSSVPIIGHKKKWRKKKSWNKQKQLIVICQIMKLSRSLNTQTGLANMNFQYHSDYPKSWDFIKKLCKPKGVHSSVSPRCKRYAYFII